MTKKVDVHKLRDKAIAISKKASKPDLKPAAVKSKK